MKRGILWLTLMIFLCAAVLPVCAAGSGFSRGGYDPYDYFGDEEGPFGFGRRDESVAETTLKCEPNARTVKSGDELGVDLHLLLSEAEAGSFALPLSAEVFTCAVPSAVLSGNVPPQAARETIIAAAMIRLMIFRTFFLLFSPGTVLSFRN